MYSIVKLATKHLSECLTISNDLLGVDYHDVSYFENAILKNQGLVAIHKEKVIGFLIFKTTKPEDSFKMYGINLSKNVGHIGSVCVNNSFQKKGIASELVEKAISILFQKHTSIYTLAWEYKGIVNLQNVLLKNAFTELNKLESVWKTECENNEFNCPVKESRCICSGIVYCLNKN